MNRPEIVWVVDGIRGLLLAKLGKEDFPHEFYEEAKRLIGYGQ